jgi:hypothetical protein
LGFIRSTQVIVAIVVLCAIGLGVFAYKVEVLNFPLRPDETTDLWDIEARVTFEGTGQPAAVRMARVQETPHLALLSENYFSPEGFGYRLTRIGSEHFVTFERRALTARTRVFYRATMVELDSGPSRAQRAPRPDTEYDAEARRILAEEEETPFIFALDALIEDAVEGSANEEGVVAQLVASLADDTDSRVAALTAGGPEGVDEPAARLALVLNAAGIPARRMAGLDLTEDRVDTNLRVWVDVWLRNGWRSIDPLTGEELDARRLVPMTEGDRPLIEFTGVTSGAVSYTVARRPEDAVTEALRRSDEAAPIIKALSLLSLPLHTQETFRVLLLIPVGAVVIAFLRQVVGLSTFGTFMPVLIAISFRDTSLFTGLVLFAGLVMIGIGLRAYFNGLQLLIVPRLAAVLSIVTLLMAFLALLGATFNIPLGFSISLFPLVIITMTIERMSLVWDEFGAREALIRGGGSLLAAAIVFTVMFNDLVKHLAFMFPELLLVAIALMIALGRYSGYKLTEYWRFRKLAEPGGPDIPGAP